jgi:hypothetical protein
MLKSDLGGSKMLKNLSSQMLLKMSSLRRAQRYISNGAKIISNRRRMRNLWPSKVWQKQFKSQSRGAMWKAHMLPCGLSIQVIQLIE